MAKIAQGDQLQPSYWALLIVIDLYPDDNETQRLEGCVRDVEELQSRLNGRDNIYTIVLRASNSGKDDCESSVRRPAEDEQTWPTLENVCRALFKIMDEASPGNVVHIHFSGHGTRLPSKSEEFGDSERGDLALVLYDPKLKTRYLHGWELASIMKQMVDKGIKAVLTLDCCFSGAVLRDDRHNNNYHQQGKIREALYNAEIDWHSKPLNIFRESYSLSRKRDAVALNNWYLNPDGYAILTACGPNEKSREIVFKNNVKRGPLTYFLLLALKSMQQRNIQISLKSIHTYVSVQFHAGLVKQTPRRYGNENIGLFSHLNQEYDPMETRVWRTKEHSYLTLEAGQVHGVVENDQYRLLALWDSDRHLESSNEPTIVKVKTVYALTSTLEAVDTKADISGVKTAWRAVPCTHLSQRRVSVGLSSKLYQHDRWQEMIAASGFLIPLLDVDRSDTSPLFSGFFIDLDHQGDYQILDEGRCAVPGLPIINSEHSSGISDIISVLDHVAKFKYIERLENRVPNIDFERSVRIQLTNPTTGQLAQDLGGVLDVTHGDELELRCVNISEESPVYLSVFNLSSSWQIDTVLRKGSDDYRELPPQTGRTGKEEAKLAPKITDTKPIKIKMTFSEGIDTDGKSDDVLKLFVTSEPVSLSSLRMAALNSFTSHQSSKQPRKGSEGDLMDLLECLSPTTRGTTRDTGRGGSWLTRNFVIHVSK
ncbi:MAG: hypothetical protein Q9167_003457 [Letrouitia subvulpina]